MCVCVWVWVCCAFVDLHNKLYKMHGTIQKSSKFIKIRPITLHELQIEFILFYIAEIYFNLELSSGTLFCLLNV
jgi:hypothetical protein